jgi:DNA mismatch repair ATPase MutS
MDKVTDAVNRLGKQVDTYVNLVRIVETMPGNDDVLTALRRRVEGAGESMRMLDDMLHKLDSRGNILGLFFFDMLFLWDYRILHTFSTWQRAYSDKFGEWIDAVSEFDMLVSMATFRYNESGLTTDAEVIDSPKVVFEAQGLFHPFLGRKAVSNDFNIADRNFYIITGANMAGKSTFLRSLGVNYVLAMNGMPVFAKKLRTSRFRLFTSMRTTDDLTHGISYFNAELLRLQQILDLLKTDEPKDGWSGLLVILDEILKGTNSEDKLTGSKMFLEYVAQKNVTGVIATHDLKLSAMEDEQPERFHNYCFEIALGTNVTYSYKISKGVARNQNATFLLRKMLEG